MRFSYGIMDQGKILIYKPQLFRKTDDLIIFPGKDFHKWHSDLNEYIDGLYQINSQEILYKGKAIQITDLDLAVGVLGNITSELENLFNPENNPDYNYQYVSMIDEKFKNRRTHWYGRYTSKIDRKIVTITNELKYKHMMEIVDYATNEFNRERSKVRNRRLKIKSSTGEFLII